MLGEAKPSTVTLVLTFHTVSRIYAEGNSHVASGLYLDIIKLFYGGLRIKAFYY